MPIGLVVDDGAMEVSTAAVGCCPYRKNKLETIETFVGLKRLETINDLYT
jgi:hypothetical protein